MASKKYNALSDQEKSRYAMWQMHQMAANGETALKINKSSDAKVTEFLAYEAAQEADGE